MDAVVSVRLAARSISRSIRRQLQQRPTHQLQVLAVFERACNLVGPAGKRSHRPVIALVTPDVGDGPLNIVLHGTPWVGAALQPGMVGQADVSRLQVGGLEVDLSQATAWEPQPDWPTLCSYRATIAAGISTLRAMALDAGRDGSILALIDQAWRWNRPREAVLVAARCALSDLKAGWIGDSARLHDGSAGLAGLGSGLTPAGDDFLCGAMLWAWVAHANPAPFCESIVEAAAPRTTTLSAAFLWAVTQGECSPAWKTLLAALAQEDDAAMAPAVKDVLACGATSGADMLAGFVWAGTHLGLS